MIYLQNVQYIKTIIHQIYNGASIIKSLFHTFLKNLGIFSRRTSLIHQKKPYSNIEINSNTKKISIIESPHHRICSPVPQGDSLFPNLTNCINSTATNQPLKVIHDHINENNLKATNCSIFMHTGHLKHLSVTVKSHLQIRRMYTTFQQRNMMCNFPSCLKSYQSTQYPNTFQPKKKFIHNNTTYTITKYEIKTLKNKVLHSQDIKDDKILENLFHNNIIAETLQKHKNACEIIITYKNITNNKLKSFSKTFERHTEVRFTIDGLCYTIYHESFFNQERLKIYNSNPNHHYFILIKSGEPIPADCQNWKFILTNFN